MTKADSEKVALIAALLGVLLLLYAQVDFYIRHHAG